MLSQRKWATEAAWRASGDEIQLKGVRNYTRWNYTHEWRYREFIRPKFNQFRCCCFNSVYLSSRGADSGSCQILFSPLAAVNAKNASYGVPPGSPSIFCFYFSHYSSCINFSHIFPFPSFLLSFPGGGRRDGSRHRRTLASAQHCYSATVNRHSAGLLSPRVGSWVWPVERGKPHVWANAHLVIWVLVNFNE